MTSCDHMYNDQCVYLKNMISPQQIVGVVYWIKQRIQIPFTKNQALVYFEVIRDHSICSGHNDWNDRLDHVMVDSLSCLCKPKVHTWIKLAGNTVKMYFPYNCV